MTSPISLKVLHCSLAVVAVLALTGCAIGPDYVRPNMDIPESYGETPAGWKVATPSDDQLPDSWWKLYNDPLLTQLVEAVAVDNQDLKATEARYRQAQAALKQARGGYFPELKANAGATRAQANKVTATTYDLEINAAWELDLWGRIRRSVEAQRANLEMSRADLAAMRLSLQTSVVQAYVEARITDARLKLMRETIEAYEASLVIAQNRYKAGVTTRADVAQAKTQLETARTQMINLEISRAQAQNSLALLIGKLPAQFKLAATDAPLLELPQIPVAVPSALLERRPDIASAERAVAAANAQIGVAKAAYFPSLSISAAGGYRATEWSDWFNLPARVWSLGASLAQLIFDGGRREAGIESAVAAYDETVAHYKQTVLTAFGEVENNLTALRVLDDAMRSQMDALAAARDAETLTLNQYKAGTMAFINVITAQTTRLNAEDNAIQLRGRQLTASAALINAVGGGVSGGR